MRGARLGLRFVRGVRRPCGRLGESGASAKGADRATGGVRHRDGQPRSVAALGCGAGNSRAPRSCAWGSVVCCAPMTLRSKPLWAGYRGRGAIAWRQSVVQRTPLCRLGSSDFTASRRSRRRARQCLWPRASNPRAFMTWCVLLRSWRPLACPFRPPRPFARRCRRLLSLIDTPCCRHRSDRAQPLTRTSQLSARLSLR